MSDMKYLDFDLAIEPSADGYTARVFNSPGGQATAEFKAPFSDLEIENFLLRVGRTRHAVRRIESPEMASAKVFGGQLFNGVFTGDVRGCLRSSLDEASRQGAGLRVRLNLSKAPALADLPWEFLYNASMNRFMSLSVETPVVRYLDLPERIRPLVVKPPLRVLMMISSPTDYPKLDVTRESAKMTEALADLEQRGLVIVERQENATLSELQRRLRKGQYHIFHFVGHGGFDTQADDGVLILEDEDDKGRRVSAQFLGTLLHDHRPLRLAVLNACEGARASRSDPFAGTAQSLVQQGIPAVIAMQFEVTDEAAICFTREFYSAVAMGYPVDAALAEARKAIFAEVSEIEWGTPVLYMRSPDGKIFEMEQVSEADRTQLHIASLLAAAKVAATSEDDATATRNLEEVLALEPGNPEATARLGAIRNKRGHGPIQPSPIQEEKIVRPPAEPVSPVPAVRTSAPKSRIKYVAAAVVALVLGAIIVEGVLPGADSTDPAPFVEDLGIPPQNDDDIGAGQSTGESPAEGSGAVVTAALRSQLEQAINTRNRAMIQAYQTLDPTSLYDAYTGDYLAGQLNQLQSLRNNGLFAVNQLRSQRFDSFAVSPDGRRAEVRLTENWATNFHSIATKMCVSHYHEQEISQKEFLELTAGGWRVFAFTLNPGTQPKQLAPCH